MKIYIGQLKDKKMHGDRAYYFSDGSKYIGEFNDGKVNKLVPGTLAFL